MKPAPKKPIDKLKKLPPKPVEKKPEQVEVKTETVKEKPTEEKAERPKEKITDLKEEAVIAGEPVVNVIDYFLYLSKTFNLKQFCDFY